MNYKSYKCSLIEIVLLVIASVLVAALSSSLFYDCFWGIAGAPIIFYLAKNKYQAYRLSELNNQLMVQFMDMLRSISAALLAGYSVENAWKEAQKEIAMLHGENSMIYRELDSMNNSVSMNIPMEKLVLAFADRTDADEIKSFAEIFAYAKRSGGDFAQIIDSTIYRICSRYETEREIEVAIASKKLEQKIMNIVPLIILAYMKLTNGEYMSVLYGNAFGVAFMTICIVVYIAALLLAEKIMDIKL